MAIVKKLPVPENPVICIELSQNELDGLMLLIGNGISKTVLDNLRLTDLYQQLVKLNLFNRNLGNPFSAIAMWQKE